uniref:NADH-ubiquinone oxidoreductase chain 4L n=1 Tax=Shinkaia crosnieri TaxID=480484 RepID=B3TZD3_SHICR|nr:NADH dehydrogenase subunit 4L [Shinkaia crosnieri]
MIYISIIIIMSGYSGLVAYRKHLLNVLLCLEFIMLGIFFFMIMFISVIGSEMYFVLFFLALVTCEGALGLSLLVLIVCFNGNDYFSSMSSLGC